MEAKAFDELLNRNPKQQTTIEEYDADYECFRLDHFITLNSIIIQKIPSAEYVHVDRLWAQETNEDVFTLMFFDDQSQIVGGCDLTKTLLIWDDEGEDTNA